MFFKKVIKTHSVSKEILLLDSESRENGFENEGMELNEIVDVENFSGSCVDFDKAPIPKPRRKSKNTEETAFPNTSKDKQIKNEVEDSKNIPSGDENCSVKSNGTFTMAEEKNQDENVLKKNISKEFDEQKTRLKYEIENKKLKTKRIKTQSEKSKKEQNINEIKEIGIDNSITTRKNESEEQTYVNIDYTKIISLKILKTDYLLLDSYVIHPMVKIHILDENGDYLKKSTLHRDILHNQENKSIDFITPILTKPFHLQEHRKLNPTWNEKIIINESFNYFTKQTSIILFFEIIDFLNATFINQNGCDAWRLIAWAFLKPQKHFSKNIRLQLFYPADTKRFAKCRSYIWWKKKKLNKYPSTLHIRLDTFIAPQKGIVTWRPNTPHETESRKSLKIKKENDRPVESFDENVSTSRENRRGKLPKNKICEIKSGDDGCLVCKFSHNGLYLAFNVLEDSRYYLVIYSLQTFDELIRFPAHKGIIYDICWTFDDHEIICASADCTVSMWDVVGNKYLHMLPHPSYVYTCAITGNKFIATGCYDGFVRLWFGTELFQELQGFHDNINQSYVTSVLFTKDSKVLLSANSTGNIFLFYQDEKCRKWSFKTQITNLDIDGMTINQIILDKREKRILVNTRDSKIRLIDVKTGFVLRTFTSATNERVQMNCSMSPCGTYVASGSECGNVYFWNTDNGNLEYVMSPYTAKIAINCVHFHTKFNYFVLSQYGNDLPLLLYGNREDRKEIKNNLAISATCEDKTDNKLSNANYKVILEKLENIICS